MRRLLRALRSSLAATLVASVPLATSAQDIALIANPSPSPAASPIPAASSAPASGDLTHLTFTATTDLHVQLVSPADDESASIARPFEVATGAGGGVELKVDGNVVPFSKIGKRTVNNKTGDTHYFYYGVALEPGPNDVILTPLGADDLRGIARRYVVYGAGRAVALGVKLIGKLYADGRTPATLHVIALDQWHHAAMAGLAVKASIIGGDARFDTTGAPVPQGTAAPPNVAPSIPAYPTSAGFPTGAIATPSSLVPGTTPIDAAATQSFAAHTDSDGVADIDIVPGLRAGDVMLRITSDDLFVDTRIHVAPFLRKPIVAGLATFGVGSVPGIPGDVAGEPGGANSRMARLALFASGSIANRALATVAYDTADTLAQTIGTGPFVDNPDERPYQTYGDASTRRDDALSQDHLYARVDLDRSSALWGEFRATTGPDTPGSLGGFDLLVNGAKLELANATAHATLFNARNDVAYARQIFTPSGLSTLGTTLRPDIVVGSDTVTLVTLDRHSGAVVTETTLTRNVDYVLDYGTGNFRFVTIPLPFDQNFNPQQVLVQYEYSGTGVAAETTGGRVDTSFANGAIRAGAGYVNDSSGTGNVSLFGQNLRGSFSGGSWSLEHLGSTGSLGSATLDGAGGEAWRASAAYTSGPNRLGASFDSTTAGFDDPFGGIATPGLTDLRATYVRTLRFGDFTAHVDRERNVGVGYSGSENDAGAQLRAKVRKRLTLIAGLEQHVYESGSQYVAPTVAGQPVDPTPTTPPLLPGTVTVTNPNGSVTQAHLEADYRIAPKVDVSLVRIADLGGSSDAALSQPSQTTAQIGVDFTNKGRAYVRELWSGAPTQSFAAGSSALTTQALATRSTAFGFERSLGAATNVDEEYVIQNTGSGYDIFQAIGVKERFVYSKRFNGDVSLQKGSAIGAGTSGFNLYGATLAYMGDRFRGTGSYQLRTGNAPGVTFAVGAAGALTPELSLVGSLNDARSPSYASNDDRISFAFRPAQNDRSVALFGYERVTGNVTTLATHTDVLSFEEVVRPTRRLEIAGRYAYKLDGDSYYAAHTSLVGVRADEKIGDRFDIAGEVRHLGVANVAGAAANGLGVEGGIRLGHAMRLAGGYDFEGSPDAALAQAPTRRGFYATITSAIDAIGGFGRNRH